jgi:hypothetical protein
MNPQRAVSKLLTATFPTELFERYQRSEKALVAAPPRVAADR